MPTSKYAHHPVRRAQTPDGRFVEIDVEMIPLIKRLWSHGFHTVTCCQDIGESATSASARRRAFWSGYALLELGIPDTLRLLDMIIHMPFFADRLDVRHPEAWSVSIPVRAGENVDWEAGATREWDAEVLPWTSIVFPKEQVPVLTDYLTGG